MGDNIGKQEYKKTKIDTRKGINMERVTNHRLLLLMTIASILVPHELATLVCPLTHVSVCRNGLCGTNKKR